MSQMVSLSPQQDFHLHIMWRLHPVPAVWSAGDTRVFRNLVKKGLAEQKHNGQECYALTPLGVEASQKFRR